VHHDQVSVHNMVTAPSQAESQPPNREQMQQPGTKPAKTSSSSSASSKPHEERRSAIDVVALAAALAFAGYVSSAYKSSLVDFVSRGFTEIGPEHVSVSQTQLIIPFDNHVVLAVCSAAWLTSIGMIMDFCLPVPADMRLKKGDQQIYIQKAIRGAVGLLIFLLEVYEVFYLRRLHRDIVWAKTPLAELLNAFSAGFFIYEMIGLVAVYLMSNRTELPLLLHHVLGVTGCFFYMKGCCSFFFSCTVMVEEISAPFTFLVWIDDKRNLSHTRGAFVRQSLLALVWIFFRCGVDVYLWYYAISQWNHVMTASGWWLYHFGFGFVTLTFYLNPYWLKMKLRYPIRHIQFMLKGQVPQAGDISKGKDGGATPRAKST